MYPFRLLMFLLVFFACASPGSVKPPVQKLHLDKTKAPFAFLPLPIGDIKPGGWLEDWAERAVSGITGHLDGYSLTFEEAWKGKSFSFESYGANPDGTGWPLEQCAYWLDGAVKMAYILNDTVLINKVSKRLDIVVDGVLNGGDSFIYWVKDNGVKGNSKEDSFTANFNTWAHSHMGRALVAYYRATHDPKILRALVKVYKQYPLGDLVNFESLTGACNIDAMSETYLFSGDPVILDSLVSFSNRPSYKTVTKNWDKGVFSEGHGVIYYENARIPALLYPWTGNPVDLRASVKAIEWGEENHMLPVGICSSEEYHAGIGSTRNIETCNVAASGWTHFWLLRATGEGDYADRMEKVFFNAAPAPVDREFKTMCYYQSMNRYSKSLPGEPPEHPGKNAYLFSETGHGPLCCVGNLNRVLPNYISNMWMATTDGGLAATLYGPCKLTTVLGGDNPVEIDCRTNYPFEEKIDLSVSPGKGMEFPLYIRVPAWCRKSGIKINGKTHAPGQIVDGFVKILRKWDKGDKVSIHFPMEINVMQGKETPYPQINYFSNSRGLAKDTTINNPFACVYYGPLLFSLPIPDKDPNNEVPGSKFNYALDVANIEKDIQIIRKPMPGDWRWQLDAPLQLRVNMHGFDWLPEENQPIPPTSVRGKKKEQIILVPYGCTKFRVTMFPITNATN